MAVAEILIGIPSKKSDGEETVYALSELKSRFGNGFERLSDDLVVVWIDEKHWRTYCFLEWNYAEVSAGSEEYFTQMWHGMGPTDPLRECRHSYIGEDGYVFYINRKNFLAAFDWLSRCYDLN